MKVYVFIAAPNPTRLRLYLAEKTAGGAEIPVEQVMVNLIEGEQNQPAHLARNPLGRLPVLELDDGSHLTESLAIIQYLEELHPDPPMIGGDPRSRARVRELERIAEISVLFPAAQIIHASNSPLGLPPKPAVAAHFEEILPRGLTILEDALADGRPFLAGDRPSIADCTLAAVCQFARFRDLDLGLGTRFEHLARWDTAYREREPAKQVLVF